ncbi:MAG: helix-turn-helix transcriptional regulator [Alphaproteobacteria bacterium]
MAGRDEGGAAGGRRGRSPARRAEPGRTGLGRTRRKPTYGAATRLAGIVHGLHERPFGWSFESIQQAFGIAERTLSRYVNACAAEVLDGAGRPILEVERRGSRRFLRLADRHSPTEAGAWAAVSFFFTWSMIRHLEGTVLDQGMDVLWDRMLKALPTNQRGRLRDIDRKFYALTVTPKDYRGHDSTLGKIVRALVDQQRLALDYASLGHAGRVHEVEPLTLLGYRGGLYLLAKSDRRSGIVWFAVERVRSVRPLVGADGRPRSFRYPKSFRPDAYTAGLFGVVEGPEVEVELLVHNDETVTYLSQRTIHPSQRVVRRPDGRTTVTLRVRGTVELANWIMGSSPWIEVLRPAALRDEIAERARAALRLHRS